MGRSRLSYRAGDGPGDPPLTCLGPNGRRVDVRTSTTPQGTGPEEQQHDAGESRPLVRSETGRSAVRSSTVACGPAAGGHATTRTVPKASIEGRITTRRSSAPSADGREPHDGHQ